MQIGSIVGTASLTWILLGLLAVLSFERGEALRVADDDMDDVVDAEEAMHAEDAEDTADEDLDGFESDADQTKELIAKGKAAEASLTCEQIQDFLPKSIGLLTDEFHTFCTSEACDFADVDPEKAFVAQQSVSLFATSADTRKCLAEVMGTRAVHENLTQFLSFVPTVLQSAPSDAGRARLQEAYLQLVSFQEGAPELASGMADRQLLHRVDIDFKEECPAPCGMCRKSGAFGFKCYLKPKHKSQTPVLSGHQVNCDTHKKRGWLRKYRYSRKCVVPDLQESAVQHVHMAAAVSCAADSILMSLSGELPTARRVKMYTTCLAMEQGNQVSAEDKAEYEQQGTVIDGVIPRGVSLVMNSILTIGLASGLAGVRAATRGNALPVLLEGRQVDFAAPFRAHLGQLAVHPEDRALYGDRAHVRRSETLQRVTACEDVYSLTTQHTLSSGMGPLTMQTMDMAKKAEEEKLKAKKKADEKDKGRRRSPARKVFFGIFHDLPLLILFTLMELAVLYFIASFVIQAFTHGTVMGVMAIFASLSFGLGAALLVGVIFYVIAGGTYSVLFQLIFGKKSSDTMEKCMQDADVKAISP